MAHEWSGERNNDIGNDIGHTDITNRVDLLQQVSLLDGNDILHMIVRHVFSSYFDSIRIDIHSQHMTGAEQGGADGQDAAAGANVNDFLAAADVFLQDGQT